MVSTIIAIVLYSYLASLLFNKGLLPEMWDVFGVKSHRLSHQNLTPDTPARAKGDNDDENFKAVNEIEQVSQPMLDSTSC